MKTRRQLLKKAGVGVLGASLLTQKTPKVHADGSYPYAIPGKTAAC